MIQEGSDVIMVKPMDEKLKKALIQYGFKTIPVPSDVIHYTVYGLEEMEEHVPYRVGIYLEELPQYIEENVALDINLFAEMQPKQLQVRREEEVEELVMT